MKLISVQEATDIVLAHPLDFGNETIPLAEATGRVLAEGLYADRDFPPFDRVTMDGIAIAYAAFAEGRRVFPIAGIQAAGQEPLTLENPDQCIEIMTGAVLPLGTDTVIRYEDVTLNDGQAQVNIETIAEKQNIHQRGKDRRHGDLIVPPHRILSPAEIGVAATIGKAQIQVKKLPRVLIISTGDEIVDIHETPLAHQIRSSNTYAISAALQPMGVHADRVHLHDNPDQLLLELAAVLEQYQMVILSGGVSEGKFDYVPRVLTELGVTKHFHKVAQRPGKPFWFGTYHDRCAIFALPGNPVSAFMSSTRYCRPWLRQCLGLLPITPAYAKLASAVSFDAPLTYFLQVQLENTPDGSWVAHPVAGGGSGDLANMSDATGFLELPPGKKEFLPGEVYPLVVYRLNG
jgi:molybdopterin molybdotransferase